MSIRIRLVLVLLLMGVVPALIAGLVATAQMQDLAIQSSQTTLEDLAKATIRDQARVTVQQVQSYLRLHPEIDLSDMAALEANPELDILAVQPVGQTGYTAVFDANGVTHFHANPEIVGVDLSTMADTLPEFWAIIAASLDGSLSEGYYDWQDADGVIRRKFMAIMPLGDTPLRVAATTYVDEFTRPAQTMTAELERLTTLAYRRFNLFVAVVGLVSLGAGLLFGIRFTAPLQEMATAAAKVAQGEWDAIRPSRRKDELGALSRAFHAMTLRMQELIQGLEQKVMERTEALEHRARYLEATAKVSRDVTSVLDLEKLLSRVVTLISEQFDFYHTGVFLLDHTGEWAVLRAASGAGGRPPGGRLPGGRMLARGRQLRVGQESIVGYVTGQGESRIALDVGTSAVVFDNPDLPGTRSEIVLPLRARGKIIGALDVQSVEPEAFSGEDATVLQTLADQIAMAISNVQLFQQVQESLEAERQAYGELSHKAWRELLRARPGLGFARDEHGVSPAKDLWRPEMKSALRSGTTAPGEDGATSLVQPIKVRGRVIGVIDAHKPDGAGEWTAEEITLMETLAEQLNVALESARLHQETQRRAARERLIGEITARVRETLDVDTVLQTTVREIGEALDIAEVEVRMGSGVGNPRSD